MKKLLSIMLALILVFSMATVAFAEGGEETTKKWDGNYDPTVATTFKQIVKTYDSENDVVVNETLSFTSTASTSNPDGGAANLTVGDDNTVTINALTTNIPVTIPSLSKAGTYEWIIKETAGNTAGVEYSTAEVHVIVLVEYDNVNHKLVIGNKADDTDGIIYYIKKENNTKAKTFENTFKSGSFTVAKDVDGNQANETDEFEISVTLTSAKPIGTNVTLAGTTIAPTDKGWTKNDNGTWTYTHTAKYSELAGAKTFSNIPVGVTVTVSEKADDERNDGYTYDSTKMDGVDFENLTIADNTDAAIVVKNTKSTTIDTGITLDSVPYFLMLSIACVGMFLLLSKKRANREY